MAGLSSTPADCPPGVSVPITSGDPADGPPVILTGLGVAPTGSFFVLGAGDTANSGTLPASAWLIPVGDIDGDGLPDWRVEAPGEGPGGWGDPLTNGCPVTMSPDHPPLVLIIQQVREDLDGDGKFDVFEDKNHNFVLDPGEDRDGDGHLTPWAYGGSGGGCEGLLREDQDCDGHLDNIVEDTNHNGICDPGDLRYPNCDVDGDGHLDAGDEDRNHNGLLDDRPVVLATDGISDENGNTTTNYPYGETRPAPGGVLVIVLAWNGKAYSLQSVTGTTDAPTPVPYRLLHTDPIDTLQFLVTGVHNDPNGFLRSRIDLPGVTLHVDPSLTQTVFDGVGLGLPTCPFVECPVIPPGRICLPPAICRPVPPFFVESSSGLITLPAASNLETGAFLSIQPFPGQPFDPGQGLSGVALSKGSDKFISAPGLLHGLFVRDLLLPGLFVPDLLDTDGDGVPLPIDVCPAVPNPDQADANLDGIGDACDPADAVPTTVTDRWSSITLNPSPGMRGGVASAYDPVHRVVVLFGGSDDATTWEYDGERWRDYAQTAGPAVCA
jgi:hypothetical protein